MHRDERFKELLNRFSRELYYPTPPNRGFKQTTIEEIKQVILKKHILPIN